MGDRIGKSGTLLCVGLDPHPDHLPRGFEPGLRGVEAFARLVLEAATPWASAVKANLAFFEAFGAEGMAALRRLRTEMPAELPFIADAKRGDIGSTSARHASAIFDHLGADAVTASPYLGQEAIAPLLEHPDGFVYVLCRTSNPGAGEFQDLRAVASVVSSENVPPSLEPLYLHVARRVAGWDGGGGGIGLVVGATAPRELAAVRAAAPASPFLVPGTGHQGGDAAAVREHAPALAGAAAGLPGGAALVNVSRAIAEAALGEGDPGESLSEAAQAWAERLRV
ncbi:MAG: orotidine-5'-phosphate decarboxylase [Chloroflexota bacterium]|nr:orotidine-5'-phosphate decarboxylase [Chloroflexota bacterium]